MYLTYSYNLFTENIVLKENIPYPQYVHEVTDGGIAVSKGMRTMPAELVERMLKHDSILEHVRKLTTNNNIRTGFMLAAGNNTWAGYLPNTPISKQYPTNRITPLGISQIFAGQLANKLGTFEYLYTDSTSCISGHSAWFHALLMLSLRYLDAVVIVAVDNGCCEEYLHIFGENGLSRLASEEDTSVNKFRLGQGSNISIFESATCLKKSKNTPLAKIKDVITCFESHTSPLGVSPTGTGYRNVLKQLEDCSIDFIKTHETFTENNAVENKIINELYPSIPRINYKHRIGHTMGASTAVETTLAIKENTGTFISLGAGMGNVFSGALVEILK